MSTSTSKLGIYGASDDNVELRLNGKDLDEIGTYGETVFTVLDGDKNLGACVLHVYHKKHGWTFQLEMPHDHEDNDPLRVVSFKPAPNGYSYEAEIELHDTDTVIVSQDGMVKAVLKDGKLAYWEQIQENVVQARCKHGLFLTGSHACPICKG